MTKLHAEIQNSTSAPLDLVLPAFGIPLIGKTATKKLSETVRSITEITPDTCERAGLGPKATENLCNWLDEELIASTMDAFLAYEVYTPRCIACRNEGYCLHNRKA